MELESGGLGVRGQESGVRGQEFELESEVGGGAEVQASGYGVFAEVPRGGASGRRQRAIGYYRSAIADS